MNKAVSNELDKSSRSLTYDLCDNLRMKNSNIYVGYPAQIISTYKHKTYNLLGRYL